MANTTLGVVTTSANEEAYVWLTKADDEISTSFTIDWGDGSTVESTLPMLQLEINGNKSDIAKMSEITLIINFFISFEPF